jgi:hypothetical protein
MVIDFSEARADVNARLSKRVLSPNEYRVFMNLLSPQGGVLGWRLEKQVD